MAKFMVGDEKYFDGHTLYQPGEPIDLDDEAQLSHTLRPLDEAALKMYKSRYPKDRAYSNLVAKEVTRKELVMEDPKEEKKSDRPADKKV